MSILSKSAGIAIASAAFKWWVKSGWIFMMLASFLIVKTIDTTYLPPVTVFDVQRVEIKPKSILISGRMYKPHYRADCELQSLSTVVNDGDFYNLYRREDGNTSTRPSGWSNFKNIEIPGENIETYTLTARHSCYGDFLWKHSTTLGVFYVNPEIKVHK